MATNFCYSNENLQNYILNTERRKITYIYEKNNNNKSMKLEI